MIQKCIFKHVINIGDLSERLTCQGIPRTLGVDPHGDLAVWFEFSEELSVHDFWILPTGAAIPEDHIVRDTVVGHALVWHLVVRDPDYRYEVEEEFQ